MLGAIIPVGKAILMGIGGLTILGSVVTLAGKRGSEVIDLDDYTWLNGNEEYVEWDDLSAEEQGTTLKGVRDGTIEL